MKIFFTVLFTVAFLFQLSCQTFSFTNDASTWGFLPEWDDFETNAFSVEYSISEWYGSVQYRIFTNRSESVLNSSRIDSLLFKTLYNLDFDLTDLVTMNWGCGLAVQFFGDLSGYEIQGGWHNNVLVRRGIPENYDDQFQQVLFPLDFRLSFSTAIAPYIQFNQKIGWPFEYGGDFRIGILSPREILPLDVSLGYAYGVWETASQAYNSSMEKQTGLNIQTSLDFWPISFKRHMFLSQQWGSGTMGIDFYRPASEPPENMVFHLNLVGVTHISIGVKVMKEFFSGPFSDLLYTGLFYKSMNGWTDAPYVYPDGGRFSSLQLGLEEGVKFKFGPFRSDLYLLMNSGIEQNQFYNLVSTRAEPLYVENSVTFEVGAGIRFFFPFFFNRKIGLAFEISNKWDLFSDGEWPDIIPKKNPVNYILSIVVSS